jgi:4a-hydroxytetrahydrobiopterin dehydratase
MGSLSAKAGVPFHPSAAPLDRKRIMELRGHVPEWQLIADKRIRRAFEFDGFAAALQFVNRIGEIAEQEGHHPEIHIASDRVEVSAWTREIDGLTESDFVLAAKIDRASEPE